MKRQIPVSIVLALLVFSLMPTNALAVVGEYASNTVYYNGEKTSVPDHVKCGDKIQVGVKVDNDQLFYKLKAKVTGFEILKIERDGGRILKLTLRAKHPGPAGIKFVISEKKSGDWRCNVYVPIKITGHCNPHRHSR